MWRSSSLQNRRIKEKCIHHLKQYNSLHKEGSILRILAAGGVLQLLVCCFAMPAQPMDNEIRPQRTPNCFSSIRHPLDVGIPSTAHNVWATYCHIILGLIRAVIFAPVSGYIKRLPYHLSMHAVLWFPNRISAVGFQDYYQVITLLPIGAIWKANASTIT